MEALAFDAVQADEWLTERRVDDTVPRYVFTGDGRRIPTDSSDDYAKRLWISAFMDDDGAEFQLREDDLEAAIELEQRRRVDAAPRRGPAPRVTPADVDAVIESESEPKARSHALASRCHVDVSTARKALAKRAKQAR